MEAMASANATDASFAVGSYNTSVFDGYEEDMGEYDESICVDNGTGDAAAWARESVRLLLSTAILLSNSFIVVAVLRSWAREGRPLGRGASASFLVLNLAAADALCGLSMVFAWIQDNVCYVYDRMIRNLVTCFLGQVFTQFFDCTSALAIIVIAVDRVMGVSHTARCRNFLNSRRTVAVIAFIWVLGMLLALTMFIPGVYVWYDGKGCEVHTAYEESIFWGTVAVVLSTLFCCYWRIHRVTLRMLRRGSLPAPRKQASTKAARMLLVIFSWDSCAYFPLLIVTIVRACGVEVNHTLRDVSSNLTLLTFLADPYIYAYNNQHTKKAVVDLIACFRRDVKEQEMEQVGVRNSVQGASMKRFRHIISTITNTSSASDEEKEKVNGQSPILKRNSFSKV